MPGALSCARGLLGLSSHGWVLLLFLPPPREDCQLSTYHVLYTLSPSSTERVSWLLPGAWHRASPSRLGSEVPVAVLRCRLQPSLHKGARGPNSHLPRRLAQEGVFCQPRLQRALASLAASLVPRAF